MPHEPPPLPEHPGKDPSSHERWVYLTQLIDAYAKRVPFGCAPDYNRFPYADEGWKEVAEREVAEDNTSNDTREALDQFFQGGQWPKTNATVAFFARERLDFAASMAAALATPPEPSNEGHDPVPRPQGRVSDIIRWLAIDIYDANHFPRHRWRNDSSDRQY